MSSVQYVVFCLLCLSSLRMVESLYNNQLKYSIESQDPSIRSSYDGLLQFERNIVKERNVRDIEPSPQSTEIVMDDHNYYNSSYFPSGADYYIDLETEEPYFTTVTHAGLSSAHLKAAPVKLPFTFPFYGHNITTAYIATGGFLYVGSFVHEFLTVTQYIAPLMGNFDSSINDTHSIIRYANNGTAFTVEWKNNHINHMEDAGGFTFQTTLMSDGRIIFAYKNIPIPVDNIRGGNGHSVTVGLSDGYYIDEPLYEGTTLYKRTIYTYHVVSMDTRKVKDNAAFVFYPLTTCNQLLTCDTCTHDAATINFDCSWCSHIDRCSSGFDRHREEWIENECDLIAVYSDCPQSSNLLGIIIGLVVITLVIVLLGSVTCWVAYACRNPTSPSGLFIIEAQSFAKGKFSKDTSNEDRYIVSNGNEESETKTDVISANGHSTPVVNTTQSTSEA